MSRLCNKRLIERAGDGKGSPGDGLSDDSPASTITAHADGDIFRFSGIAGEKWGTGAGAGAGFSGAGNRPDRRSDEQIARSAWQQRAGPKPGGQAGGEGASF